MSDADVQREQAIRRIREKRNFQRSLAVYVVVNAFLVVIWAMGDRGSFWPIWPIAGWGLGIAFQAWRVYGEQPITEAEIQREMTER